MDLVSQNLLMTSGGKKSTYVDDVYSTYVYKGNGVWGDDGTGSQTITNGIDNSEGGLLWTKARSAGESHTLFDTERASNKAIYSNLNSAEGTRDFNLNFLSNGFSWNTYDGMVNDSNQTYASWNFRKAPGFFDVVTWTGNGTAGRTISHSLSSVPGMILVKRTDTAADWAVYHRSNGATKIFYLNSAGGIVTDSDPWNDTEPTSSVFTVGDHAMVNANGGTYVAYVFAGGESTAATARSVAFDGANDIRLGTHSDLGMGTDDSTFEAWIKPDFNGWNNQYSWFYSSDNQGFCIGKVNSNFVVQVSAYNYISTTTFPQIGQWTHVSVTKQYVSSSNKSYIKLFFNGNLIKTYEDTGTINWPTANNTGIGGAPNGDSAYFFAGKISNLRIVKGTALYTSSFRPPIEPLTNITNTKLLCCNTTTATGATVTPGTISQYNNPIPSTHVPFDDPEGYKFGEGGDQNLIKCGSFFGNGSSTGPEVYLGFEPQWVLTKNSGISDEWYIFDSMRGIVTGGYDPRLRPNSNGAESSGDQRLDLTPTGFKITSNNGDINGNGNKIIYMAIRRPDGYVGKPLEAGTDAFAMDTWVSDSTPASQPNMISNFPVDFVLDRDPTYDGSWQGNWHVRGRLIQNLYLQTQSTAAQGTGTWGQFDYSTGWMNRQGLTGYTNWQSWMWKRGQGFDVVCYTGNLVAGRQITHSLNKIPEMLWVKRRNDASDWVVWHKGLNSGTNSGQYYVALNSSNAESSASYYWNNTTQNSTTFFTLGGNASVNGENDTFIAMLFASVDGISSVGSYSPTSSSTTVTCGFQPRFVIVKAITKDNIWSVADSLRGITAGNDPCLVLNETWSNDKYGGADWIDVSSTGFTVNSAGGAGTADANSNGETYIYYAHA